MTNPNDPVPQPDEGGDAPPPSVLVFNAIDPSGAGGLSADVLCAASVGAHALPVCCGVWARDSAEVFDFFPIDEEAVSEQARAIVEDVSARVIKVGFVGSPETLGVIAELAADYADTPLVAYMPSLAWWEDGPIESYQDAFRELLLPQTTVLVGNHSTLWRWLLPDWSSERSPGPRDIARAAAQWGVPYVLVSGIALPEQFIDNALATPQAVLVSERFERFDAVFSGAGETLSGALAALLATGSDLSTACLEALAFLDRSLDAGFRPGMGQVLPDRLFWAQTEPDDDEPGASDAGAPTSALEFPGHDTQH